MFENSASRFTPVILDNQTLTMFNALVNYYGRNYSKIIRMVLVKTFIISENVQPNHKLLNEAQFEKTVWNYYTNFPQLISFLKPIASKKEKTKSNNVLSVVLSDKERSLFKNIIEDQNMSFAAMCKEAIEKEYNDVIKNKPFHIINEKQLYTCNKFYVIRLEDELIEMFNQIQQYYKTNISSTIKVILFNNLLNKFNKFSVLEYSPLSNEEQVQLNNFAIKNCTAYPSLLFFLKPVNEKDYKQHKVTNQINLGLIDYEYSIIEGILKMQKMSLTQLCRDAIISEHKKIIK